MTKLFALVLVVSTAFAQEQQVLNGKVVDQTGAVIARASILLIDLQTLRTWQARTGDEGDFSFQGLPKGKYEIKAVHPGFSTFSKRIKVNDSKPVKITIELKVDPKAQVVELSLRQAAEKACPRQNASFCIIRFESFLLQPLANS